MSETLPELDIETIASGLDDAELVAAAKDPHVLAAQTAFNRLIAKTNDMHEACSIGGIVKALVMEHGDIDVGDDARQAGMGVLKWLATQLKTEEGKTNLKSTTDTIAALVAPDSELWAFAVLIGKALEPVLRKFQAGWRSDLSYKDKEAKFRSAIAELVQSIVATFPIKQISLPKVEVPGLGGTLRLFDLTITNVRCEVAPPIVTGEMLQTTIPHINYNPMQQLALKVSNLSFDAKGSFERVGSRVVSDYAGVGNITASNCSVRASLCRELPIECYGQLVDDPFHATDPHSVCYLIHFGIR